MQGLSRLVTSQHSRYRDWDTDWTSKAWCLVQAPCFPSVPIPLYMRQRAATPTAVHIIQRAGCPKNCGSIPGGEKTFPSPKRPDRLWSPPNRRLFYECLSRFQREYISPRVRLAIHLNLLPRLRMSRAIPAFSHMPSRREKGLDFYGSLR